MKILMISLDKQILDPESRVAQRMIERGKEDELFILIPASEKKEVALSETVHVWSTGGNKLQQYFRLKKMGLELLRKHEIKFITVQDPSFSGNIGRWLKNKTGATLEIQLHGDFYGSDFYKRTLKDFIGYHFFGKRNIHVADKIRVVSERIRKNIVNWGADSKKVYIRSVSYLVNGKLVTKEPFDFQSQYPGYEKYFVFVGRLEEVKGADWLIDIFREIIQRYGRKFLLLIVGEGSQKSLLRSLVEKKGLQKYVLFKGWTSQPAEFMATADCVVFPSQSEGYGLVPMEAHELGTPVIMNDVGVANYELQTSDKVKIIPVSDRDAWIQAMLSI